jgi:hydroxymethylbilane synthase
MQKLIRIGTRESQLAIWQATQVKDLLEQQGMGAELLYIKSDGDIDLKTPLYEMGVQGIFTRSLDSALSNHHIDIAVHSMKDVPTQLAAGLRQAAVLKRGPVHDLLVFKKGWDPSGDKNKNVRIATSSIRRRAQWLHRHPTHTMCNLRGNVNTRLRRLDEEDWDAAIFAQAGLERIGMRPENSVVLDWMIPAPAQGAIMIACREEDEGIYEVCLSLNDEASALCTKIEREFLRGLLGGCSTPISALAEIEDGEVYFCGNIVAPDGSHKIEVERILPLEAADDIGRSAAGELLERGGREIISRLSSQEPAENKP